MWCSPALPPTHCSLSFPLPPTSCLFTMLTQVLAAGRVEQLADSFGIGAGLAQAASAGGASAGGAQGGEGAGGPQYMALDGAALENLEVRACTRDFGWRVLSGWQEFSCTGWLGWLAAGLAMDGTPCPASLLPRQSAPLPIHSRNVLHCCCAGAGEWGGRAARHAAGGAQQLRDAGGAPAPAPVALPPTVPHP